MGDLFVRLAREKAVALIMPRVSTNKRSRRSGNTSRIVPREWQPRRAVVKGQDGSQWWDIYHFIRSAPWWVFFVGVAAVFAVVNTIFALLYMADPRGIQNAHGFWDYFLFSVQTIGSANYTVLMPRSVYANVIVSVEAFFGILNLALITGVTFARFSRPFARIVFSGVAVIIPFDGVPTLMFRAANQRGNQILDASVTVSLARQVTTREGIVMRRFEELKLVRARTPLFGLSWTVMHQIDETSPLYGVTFEVLRDMQVEIIVLLSGTDDALADIIYARHSYMPDEILWNRRFVDVITITPTGRRVVDLHHFHETLPLPE
jgi:inward rectifier potassium channel